MRASSRARCTGTGVSARTIGCCCSSTSSHDGRADRQAGKQARCSILAGLVMRRWSHNKVCLHKTNTKETHHSRLARASIATKTGPFVFVQRRGMRLKERRSPPPSPPPSTDWTGDPARPPDQHHRLSLSLISSSFKEQPFIIRFYAFFPWTGQRQASTYPVPTPLFSSPCAIHQS